jgi:hypothetical protein
MPHIDREVEVIVNGSPVSSSNPLPTAPTGGPGSPTTIPNGADTAGGSTTDLAIVSNVDGTRNGFLRGLVKILADVWNSTSHFLNVNLNTLISGEDQTNDRLRTFPKPVSGDQVMTTLQNAVATAVNGSTDACAGYTHLGFQITITATITVTMQGSMDGGLTFFTLPVHNTAATETTLIVAGVTSSGFFAVPTYWCGILTHLRAPTSGPSGSPSATVVSVKCP